MKTIGQEACELAEKEMNATLNVRSTSIRSFKAGVEFAQRWIPVEEELSDNKDVVLLKTSEDYFFTGRYSKVVGFCSIGVHTDFNEVTHWRPIERV